MRLGKNSGGFTLIEMSIVLVVIGLIVGGIFVGQTLIAAARLQKVVTEIHQFKTAIATFRGKYDCLPGDCNNAYMFFSSSGCTNNSTNSSAGCNGNGDGTIGSGFWTERCLLWFHLSITGLISSGVTENKMTSYCGGGAAEETNLMPPSAFNSNAHYAVFTEVGAVTGYLFLGGYDASQQWPYDSLFTPNEARSLDQKLDDGFRTTGNIQGHYGNDVTGNQCQGGSDGYTLQSPYTQSQTVPGCVLNLLNMY
jgi:prepilin-type N-terminal cleavage/methylation domain-containing protein